MTRSDVWKKRPAVVAYRAYGDELRLKLPNYQLPEDVKVVFYLPMPRSWSKKKREAMDLQPHKQRPDVDNLIKGLFDHLAEEDSYIWRVQATKLWAETGAIELDIDN